MIEFSSKESRLLAEDYNKNIDKYFTEYVLFDPAKGSSVPNKTRRSWDTAIAVMSSKRILQSLEKKFGHLSEQDYDECEYFIINDILNYIKDAVDLYVKEVNGYFQ